jgi:hypothetical protein
LRGHAREEALELADAGDVDFAISSVLPAFSGGHAREEASELADAGDVDFAISSLLPAFSDGHRGHRGPQRYTEEFLAGRAAYNWLCR